MLRSVDTENINIYIEHHPDMGCEYCNSCLNCPFSRCIDEGWKPHERLKSEANRLLKSLGLTDRAIEIIFEKEANDENSESL